MTMISSVTRLRFILTTTFLFGGRMLVERLRLLYLVPLRHRIALLFGWREEPPPLIRVVRGQTLISPRVLRELLERLGPTFVKLGQIMSLRPDFVGEEMSRELSRLQSSVASFPPEEVEEIVSKELGDPPDRLFSAFERSPVAAASLAQVHRAWLKDGTEVAVKVQRPDIRKTIEQDIALLAYFARLAERLIPEARPYQPTKIVREFADWTMRELDFAAEGHNAERFRVLFEGNGHIKIPRIYWPFTTSRILTMEFIHGVRPDDLPGIEALGLDRTALALFGVDAELQQILVNGFFHGDPHPGNCFAMAGNILCFYDFGIVGYLGENQRRELVSCFVAFAGRDIEAFLKHFLHLAEIGDESDVKAFTRDASTILSEIFFSPVEASIARVFFRLIHDGARRHVSFPADLALFAKALVTTESMGLTLYPDFDFNDHLAPYVTKAFEAYVDPDQFRRSFANDVIDWVALLKELPERIQGLLRRSEGEECVRVRLDPESTERMHRELDRQSDRRLSEVCLIAVLFLVVLWLSSGLTAGIGHVARAGVAFFLALFLLFLLRAARKV